MAKQKIFIVNAGVPAPLLSPVFTSLQEEDGTPFTPLPVISEVDDGTPNGAGWYIFDQPSTSVDLVGVVDADPGGVVGLPDADRYIPVDITPDDFGMTDMIDMLIKGEETLDPDNNTLTVLRRDGLTTLVVFDVTKPLDLNKLIGPYIKRKPQ